MYICIYEGPAAGRSGRKGSGAAQTTSYEKTAIALYLIP